MKKTLRLWMLAAPLAAFAQLADMEVSAPTLTYALGANSGELRAIQGVPGAAVLGNRVHLNAQFKRVWISPARRYAAAVTSNSKLALVKLDGAAGAALILDGAEPMAAGFSPKARWMALERDGAIELWGGLPDRPERARSWATPSPEVSRIAVSDDGSMVAVLASGRVSILGPGSQQAELDASGLTDIFFLSDSQTLLAADGAANRVLSWNKVSEPGAYSVAATEKEGVLSPVALNITEDERTLVVLTAQSVVLIDRNSGRSEALPLDGIAADGLWRATGNAVFLLTSSARNGLWMLDADAAAARLFAVAGRDE